MEMLRIRTALRPHTKAYLVAGLLIAFAVSDLFYADSEHFAFSAIFSSALVIIAISMVFRFPYARIAALVPLALTAAISLIAIAYNAIMLFIAPPPTNAQVVGFVLSVAIGITTALSAHWLESAQAKAYFSRAAI